MNFPKRFMWNDNLSGWNGNNDLDSFAIVVFIKSPPRYSKSGTGCFVAFIRIIGLSVYVAGRRLLLSPQRYYYFYYTYFATEMEWTDWRSWLFIARKCLMAAKADSLSILGLLICLLLSIFNCSSNFNWAKDGLSESRRRSTFDNEWWSRSNIDADNC